jgi:hypothetical protein
LGGSGVVPSLLYFERDKRPSVGAEEGAVFTSIASGLIEAAERGLVAL